MGLIDLHLHSSASDGVHRPSELVRMAVEADIDVMALTDHDTVSGIPEFEEAARKEGILPIAGLEISTRHERPGSMHILIYGADHKAPEMEVLLEAMSQSREERAPLVVEMLKQHGVELDLGELLQMAGGPAVSKVHIAHLLVRHGYAGSSDQAFERYLRRGRPGHVDRLKWTPDRCVRAARASGGVPVLAHPCYLDRDDPLELDTIVGGLKRLGLMGIEVHYPDHSPDQRSRFGELARRHGLLETGGTDFHGGEIKPGVRMGTGRGDGFMIPVGLADKLIAAMERAVASG